MYNPGAYLPRLTKPDSPEYNANVGYNTSRYLLNAAYMRLKNLMISYNFQPKLVKKMGLENLKVYFTCDNLFTIDNLPDVMNGRLVTLRQNRLLKMVVGQTTLSIFLIRKVSLAMIRHVWKSTGYVSLRSQPTTILEVVLQRVTNQCINGC